MRHPMCSRTAEGVLTWAACRMLLPCQSQAKAVRQSEAVLQAQGATHIAAAAAAPKETELQVRLGAAARAVVQAGVPRLQPDYVSIAGARPPVVLRTAMFLLAALKGTAALQFCPAANRTEGTITRALSCVGGSKNLSVGASTPDPWQCNHIVICC